MLFLLLLFIYNADTSEQIHLSYTLKSEFPLVAKYIETLESIGYSKEGISYILHDMETCNSKLVLLCNLVLTFGLTKLGGPFGFVVGLGYNFYTWTEHSKCNEVLEAYKLFERQSISKIEL